MRKDSTENEALEQQEAVKKLQELLTAKNGEIEQLRATLSEKSIEIKKLRAKLDDLKAKFAEEQENCKRYKGLAQENFVQTQELDRKLTDFRNGAKVNKEQKDDFDRYSSL